MKAVVVVHRVPAHLPLVRVCQACHTTGEDIVSKSSVGPMEVRGVVARRVLIHQKASSAAVEACLVHWSWSEGAYIL